MLTLIEQLAARGFHDIATGGNCRAFIRYRPGVTDVITDIGGLELPTESDWHFCTYAGDWLADTGENPLSGSISEDAPLGLIETVDSCSKT